MSLIERFFPIHRPDFSFFDSSRFHLFDFDAEFMQMKAEMKSMHELMDRQFDLMRERMFNLTPMEPLSSSVVEIEPSNPLVTVDGETKLKLNFNVQGFKPEEVEVKVIGDNVLQVVANSVEKSENGEHKRYHMSQYTLPNSVLPDKIKPVMSKDGILTIEAPTTVAINVL